MKILSKVLGCYIIQQLLKLKKNLWHTVKSVLRPPKARLKSGLYKESAFILMFLLYENREIEKF